MAEKAEQIVHKLRSLPCLLPETKGKVSMSCLGSLFLSRRNGSSSR
jgi:hypothetical protein